MSSSDRGIMSDIEWRSPAGRLFVGICFVSLCLVGIVVLFPYLFSFTAGLKTSTEVFKPGLHIWPNNPNWKNYVDAWNNFHILRMFQNSSIAAGGGVIAQFIVSSLAAYSLSRLNPKGKDLIMTLMLITMAIPSIAFLIPRYLLMTDVPILHISLLGNWWSLWLVYAISPFMVLVLKNAFDNIPKEIFEAAKMDGASEWRIFLYFALPLTATLALVLCILGFITLWGDFLWPYLMFVKTPDLQTVPVRLFVLTRQFGANLFLAGSFIAMLPPTIAAFILQRYMRGGLTF